MKYYFGANKIGENYNLKISNKLANLGDVDKVAAIDIQNNPYVEVSIDKDKLEVEAINEKYFENSGMPYEAIFNEVDIDEIKEVLAKTTVDNNAFEDYEVWSDDFFAGTLFSMEGEDFTYDGLVKIFGKEDLSNLSDQEVENFIYEYIVPEMLDQVNDLWIDDYTDFNDYFGDSIESASKSYTYINLDTKENHGYAFNKVEFV